MTTTTTTTAIFPLSSHCCLVALLVAIIITTLLKSSLEQLELTSSIALANAQFSTVPCDDLVPIIFIVTIILIL